jgi:hypothetical protein
MNGKLVFIGAGGGLPPGSAPGGARLSSVTAEDQLAMLAAAGRACGTLRSVRCSTTCPDADSRASAVLVRTILTPTVEQKLSSGPAVLTSIDGVTYHKKLS